VRIVFSDGTIIERDLVPSKRNTKGNGQKSYNARRTEQAVGGFRNDNTAIYHGYEHGTTNYDNLCIVVSDNRTFTSDPQQLSPSYGGKRTS
jgi:hypothetical protein